MVSFRPEQPWTFRESTNLTLAISCTFFSPMLISEGCYNKLQEAEWLWTRETDFLTVLEARSLKSRCEQNCTPSKGSRAEPIPRLFQLLRVAGVPWLAHTPTSASMVTWLPPLLSQNSLCLSLLTMHLTEFRARKDKLLFTLLHPLPYKVIFTGSREKENVNMYFVGPHHSVHWYIAILIYVLSLYHP